MRHTLAKPLSWVVLATIAGACSSNESSNESSNREQVSPLEKDASADDVEVKEQDSSPPASCTPYTLHVATNGADGSDGQLATPLRTLMGAQARLASVKPDCDVFIRIAEGVYSGDPSDPATRPHVYWTYELPVGRKIYFVPETYADGKNEDPMIFAAPKTRPIFDGSFNGVPNKNSWFASHSKTPMVFRYLEVKNFVANGILIDASDGNDLYGMTFRRIGNKWGGVGMGYGGVSLKHSRDNRIVNCHFIDLENNVADAVYIHALYLLHSSNDNLIKSNEFRNVSGNAVKLRNDCRGNTLEGNKFVKTSLKTQGVYMDHFCNADPVSNPSSAGCGEGDQGECPSWNNVFRSNELGCSYDGQAVPAAYLAWSDLPNGRPSYCVSPPTGSVRVEASANVSTCAP